MTRRARVTRTPDDRTANAVTVEDIEKIGSSGGHAAEHEDADDGTSDT